MICAHLSGGGGGFPLRLLYFFKFNLFLDPVKDSYRTPFMGRCFPRSVSETLAGNREPLHTHMHTEPARSPSLVNYYLPISCNEVTNVGRPEQRRK